MHASNSAESPHADGSGSKKGHVGKFREWKKEKTEEFRAWQATKTESTQITDGQARYMGAS